MTKKIMVPEIRFEGFGEEWEVTLLSKLMTFSNGINAPKESYGKGRKMISVLDILDDSPLKYEGIRNSVSVNEDVENSNRVDKGDLVFVRSSEVVSEVGWGKAYLDEKYALYSGFSIRGKRKDKYEALFLELSINEKARKQIERRSGGSTRFNVNQSILNELKVAMPRLDEQKKISHIFKILNTNINSRKHELTKLQNFKQAMLQKMFPKEGERIPEVRFEGFSGEWETVKLGNVLSYEQPTKYIVESDKYINTRKIPVLTAGKSLLLGYTDETEGIYKAREKNGVIIFDDFTTSSHLIEFDFKVKSSALKLLTTKSSDYNLYFIYNLIKNINYIPGNHERHWISIFSEFDVLVPTKEEQLQIGNFFKNMDFKIKLEEQNLQKLKQIKSSMLQKMFV
ncbi:restriction endonuclease subunit S [Lederbergia lenta]|uniref:restriction endonuclease subunit S n=1 Tax=Lederbergia lenta TaxID=1467 RepID=UPI00203E2D57|nr:restriction endonuclease subunit S [Lederbergia lenta]MCM3112827.1 restriction endonuclease subunit S [Lederbergia lenta]